ncbi:alaS protein [alpha proteobacterium IMCC14465]|uniref:Alanine--tRNA ligase n=1 Tax=alpha proteobacterium IMCC14465 TaxID=1220535 RepID=J9DY45_9PROT|nr:alaS protein [alpha proteobacterium IMCC14465]
MSLGLADIRTSFLGYFETQEHKALASSPLVPLNDPTLLFTNAGMVPFKNFFTGQEAAPHQRVVTSQKCVRAGGKHNDLDNVGYTARHHTFFEMLGNFSFGDYFKEDAIHYAWQFLTKELQISQEKLLVTVYAEDEEAKTLWKKIAGLSDDRIIPIATSDNFWSMGDTGPCGPCSEIFYDHGPDIAGGPPGSPDEDGDRFIEIWNLVFMQFEQHADGSRTDLPEPSIDTGMGLERIGALLQGKHDNYDTDLMQYLIAASEDFSNQPADGVHKVSHRVIADHLRSAAFLIADGVLPSNEGRGYVLRRIMRRAMRHAQLLGTKEPLMWKLLPALKNQMAVAYPELERAGALITETLKHEEERFRETLTRGLKLLDDALEDLNGKVLPGNIAFKLYDTYGFPLDLTQDALRERGLRVDEQGFETAMEKQRAEARASWSGSGEMATETVWFDVRDNVGMSEFVGYQGTEAEAKISAILIDGEPAERASAGQEASIIVNQTPFYAESGGQAGDKGTLKSENAAMMSVANTLKKLGDMHVHIGEVQSGELAVGDIVHLAIDDSRRSKIRSNHSATHLLHEALRRVLGDHVTQKGSLVEENYLRFDFSHPKAMTDAELRQVEDIVNAVILSNHEVSTRLMTPDEAIEAGALALFGEKYGDEVRVLAMGKDVGKDVSPNGDADGDTSHRGGHYSVELCGGTHVNRLGDIGLFAVTQEMAVASGVRRIEAMTGHAARHYLKEQEEVLGDIAGVLKAGQKDLPTRIAGLLDDKKRLERELAEAKKALALGGGQSSGADTPDDIIDVNGTKFLGKIVQGLPSKELRSLVDGGKQQIGSGVVVFIGIDDGKVGIAVGVTQDLTETFDAVSLVRIGAEKLGGKGGGGRPDMAQAGGSDIENAPAALDAIKASL